MRRKRYSIGVVAPSMPSAGARRDKVIKAIAYLEAAGHRVSVGEGVYNVLGYKSGSAEQRAAELVAFLRDPSIDLIIATTGGYNSNEMLEFLDLPQMLRSNKIFVGYSDCTAISMALQAYDICTTVCGPMLVDLVDYPECFEDLFVALESPELEFINRSEVWESFEKGRFALNPMQRLPDKGALAQGQALAANLSTLNLMLGTPYLPPFSGRVLFLEYDREEQRALPSLERFMWQLRQAGILQELAGLVFGALQPSVAAEQSESDTIERILSEVTAGYEYPVIYNAQFGHIYPSWVVVNGRGVRVSEASIWITRE